MPKISITSVRESHFSSFFVGSGAGCVSFTVLAIDCPNSSSSPSLRETMRSGFSFATSIRLVSILCVKY